MGMMHIKSCWAMWSWQTMVECFRHLTLLLLWASYRSSEWLFLHPACASASVSALPDKTEERSGYNTAASDISSPPFPLQMNTQSIRQWINNERCRTTTLDRPSWFQPFKASLASCLPWWCRRQEGDLFGAACSVEIHAELCWFDVLLCDLL